MRGVRWCRRIDLWEMRTCGDLAREVPIEITTALAMRLLGIDKVLTACAARVFVLAQPMVVHAVGPLSTYSFVPCPPPPLTG